MNNAITRTKNFVKRNKTKMLVTGFVTTSTIMVLQHQGIKSLNEFLEEKGLLEEYYHFDEE